MSDDDEHGHEEQIACSYCGETESLTFVMMNTGSMATACSRCAAIMTEARAQLEKTALYWRSKQDRQEFEARFSILIAAMIAGVGVTAQWGIGYGASASAGILGIFAVLRVIKG